METGSFLKHQLLKTMLAIAPAENQITEAFGQG
jgi:hypothetical protein